MIIPRAVKQVANTALTKTQKFSPEILTVVGIAGFIGAGVLAARATLKLEETLDRISEDRRELALDARLENREVDKKALAKAYAKGVLELTKLYGPPVGMAVGATTSILVGHGIMKRRNVALVAAYGVLEKAFGEYRARVIQEFGEDKDREVKSGLHIKETTKDGKTKKTIVKTDDLHFGEYEFMFAENTSIQWSKEADYNMFFLSGQQTYWNDRLYARGHVFLNEVLDALGLAHTPAGAVVGWIRNSETGDHFIDFGFDKWENIAKGSILDGTEGHILLEFNVDGTMWDKI